LFQASPYFSNELWRAAGWKLSGLETRFSMGQWQQNQEDLDVVEEPLVVADSP
jgi:hypothetical protein